MADARPYASLGPTLLARKGAAKPAMRPQHAPIGVAESAQLSPVSSANLDDLGWNDMGDSETQNTDASILPLTPAKPNPKAEARAEADDAQARAELARANDEPPAVVRQQRALDADLSASPAEPAKALPKPSATKNRKSSTKRQRKAAFTLRLDPERHLRLRVASTLSNRSSQQLVTEALDRFLADIPDLDSLAAQMRQD